MKVTARVQRSGDWWAVTVTEVDGVFTQAKRLEQVPEMVADAVATMLGDIGPKDVEVAVVPDLSEGVSATVADAQAKAVAARAATQEASRAMREAVDALRRGERLTARDTARILGISHQRVSQLENA